MLATHVEPSARSQINNFLGELKAPLTTRHLRKIHRDHMGDLHLAATALKRAREAYKELRADAYQVQSLRIVHAMRIKLALSECRKALRHIEKSRTLCGLSDSRERKADDLDRAVTRLRLLERGLYRRLRIKAPDCFSSVPRNQNLIAPSAIVSPTPQIRASAPVHLAVSPRVSEPPPLKVIPISQPVSLLQKCWKQTRRTAAVVLAGAIGFLGGKVANSKYSDQKEASIVKKSLVGQRPLHIVVPVNTVTKASASDPIIKLTNSCNSITEPVENCALAFSNLTNVIFSAAVNSTEDPLAIPSVKEEKKEIPTNPAEQEKLNHSSFWNSPSRGPGTIGSGDGLSSMGEILRDFVVAGTVPNELAIGLTDKGDTVVDLKTTIAGHGVHIAALRTKYEGEAAYLGVDILSRGDGFNGLRVHAGVLADVHQVRPVLDARGIWNKDIGHGNLSLSGGVGYYPEEKTHRTDSESKIPGSAPHFSYSLSLSSYPAIEQVTGSTIQTILGVSSDTTIQEFTPVSRYYAGVSLQKAIIGKPLIPFDMYIKSTLAFEGNTEFNPGMELSPGAHAEVGIEGRYKNTFFNVGTAAASYIDGNSNAKGLVRLEQVIFPRKKSLRIIAEYQKSLHENTKTESSSRFLPKQDGFRVMISKSF